MERVKIWSTSKLKQLKSSPNHKTPSLSLLTCKTQSRQRSLRSPRLSNPCLLSLLELTQQAVLSKTVTWNRQQRLAVRRACGRILLLGAPLEVSYRDSNHRRLTRMMSQRSRNYPRANLPALFIQWLQRKNRSRQHLSWVIRCRKSKRRVRWLQSLQSWSLLNRNLKLILPLLR